MSFTRLRFHITTATKGRRRLILPEVEAVLVPALFRVAEDAGGTLIRVGGVEDHSHIVAGIRPTVPLSRFVGVLKGESSKIIREKFPELDFAWQRGYGAFTVNPYDMDALIAYVDNQKEHHLAGTLWEPFEYIPDE